MSVLLITVVVIYMGGTLVRKFFRGQGYLIVFTIGFSTRKIKKPRRSTKSVQQPI